MKASVGAYEAKTHLAELLRRVESGETITITKHGKPVAVMTPPSETARPTYRGSLRPCVAFESRKAPS